MVREKSRWLVLAASLAACLFASDVGLRAQGRNISFALGSAETDNGQASTIPLTVSTDVDLQGLVAVFEWDGRKANGISLAPATGDGEALADAELVETRVEDDYMILGVVMDIDGADAEVIPAGQDILVAEAMIQCDCPESGRTDVALVFVDGVHSRVDGGPLLDNLAVTEGLSITQAEGLVLENGNLTCVDDGGGEGPTITCGGPLDEQGNLPAAEGAPGETVSVCFYYTDPADQGGGNIQGFSLGVQYDCRLACVEKDDPADYLGDGALAAAEVEFFELHCDNDPEDGDGCEMVVGALLDVTAPHDGRTLPATDDLSLLFCVDFTISESAEPDTCLDVAFVDGVDGRGSVPTDNLVSIEFFEQRPTVVNCQVCVVNPNLPFIRGDCNFNGTVNVADAAAQVGAFFLGEDDGFLSPCHDACDANDDGVADVTDVIYLLSYLFRPGSPILPPPFPEAGEDPTDDDAFGCLGEAAPIGG